MPVVLVLDAHTLASLLYKPTLIHDEHPSILIPEVLYDVVFEVVADPSASQLASLRRCWTGAHPKALYLGFTYIMQNAHHRLYPLEVLVAVENDEGLGVSARVVTAAAAIMISVFLSFVVAEDRISRS